VTREQAGTIAGLVVTTKTARAIQHVLAEVTPAAPRTFKTNPKKK
jgi:hypothetical protein